MEIIEAVGPDQLRSIEQRLHDVSLALPEAWPEGGATIRLAGVDEDFELVPVREWGPFAWFERRRRRVFLVVEGVARVQLYDDAEVGSLDLARLTFDETSDTLTVKGNLPVELRINVERLAVRAEITDQFVVSGHVFGLRPRRARN